MKAVDEEREKLHWSGLRILQSDWGGETSGVYAEEGVPKYLPSKVAREFTPMV